MAVAEIGNNSRTSADYQREIIFKTYSYQNGKGQETVYHAKDCVQISMDSYEIPQDADNYEEVRNMLKTQGSRKIASLGNKMFYETYEVMEDFYSGKLSRDEVRDIFKEYFYHYMGTSLAARQENAAEGVQQGNCYLKQFATSTLAGLYEYFSRANTRNACAQNEKECEELMERFGINRSGSCYYHADWYYACEEMQELFRQTADELADEYGAERVDFEYVEKNTRFTLDGGITYNGVWDFVKDQTSWEGAASRHFLDTGMEPPRGFVYFSTSNSWDGKGDTAGFMDEMKNRRKGYASMLFLMAAAQGTSEKGSLLLDSKYYSRLSSWKEDDDYTQAVSFLKNFNINWNYRGSRLEFMLAG